MLSSKPLAPKVVLIGSGSRVISDILPVLQLFTSDITIYSRFRRKIIINNQFYQVLSYELDYQQPSQEYFLIISTPPDRYQHILLEYRHFHPLCSHLLLDTPIINEFNTLPSIPTTILEDFPFSPFSSLLSYIKSNNKFVLLYNLLFQYHGISLLRKLDIPIDSVRPFGSYVAAGNILFNKQRDYHNGFILSSSFPFIHNPCIHREGLFLRNVLIDKFDCIESCIYDEWSAHNSKIELFDDINLLKHIGLKRLFYTVFNDPSKSAYPFASALLDYQISRNLSLR